MNTPIFKKFKQRGTTIYIFPSGAEDFNLSTFQNLQQMNFTKFALLDIPVSTSYNADATKKNVLQFHKTTSPASAYGENFYNWDPNTSSPSIYGEQLVESLRNYVANHDATERNSKISNNKSFYNVSENQTPVEMVFWKWCRKLNIIDFEPAINKQDWDKKLPDFDNPNANVFTSTDYFRKYLWKERDVNIYGSGTTTAGEFTINQICKFREGDFIYFSGVTGLSGFTDYKVTDVTFGSNTTTVTVTPSDTGTFTNVYLNYHRLIQYVGEVQATSKTQASQQNFTEFTAMVPPQCGKTPTILFKLDDNLNYYPGMQLPIMTEQIQPEILGAEYLASPIRTNPNDYPGSYFGYFDTLDKTYITSDGDRLRKNGDYYGILLTDNSGLDAENYVEKLTDFNSTNIDGVSLDFDYSHYYKMNLPDTTVYNFDEFNAISVNGNPPEDFQFNAILWYYEIVDSNGNVKTNLFGIEFMNNPDDDFGSSSDKIITPIQKLASNDDQDGSAYIFNLNLDMKVDNDMLPLKFDPTAIYNIFGFDLYNNIMSNYGKLNESFITIINEFIRINNEMLDLKSLIWSQTDIDSIKQRLNNYDYLLKLYSQMQLVNTDTVKVEVDYSKVYPAVKLHAQTVEYENIYNLYSNDILTYSLAYSGNSTVTSVPDNGNRFLINVFSNIVNNYTGETLSLGLDSDLDFKQSCDIVVRPDLSVYSNKMEIYIMYSDGYPDHNLQKKVLMSGIDLPVNVLVYDILNPTGSTLNDSVYYNISSFITNVWVNTNSGTTIEVNTPIFKTGDYAYIDNFYLQSGTTDTILDYSGLYYLSGNTTGTTNQFRLYYNPNVYVDLIGSALALPTETYPKISYYLGIQLNILRISDDPYSDIPHRYSISKKFLTNDSIVKFELQSS